MMTSGASHPGTGPLTARRVINDALAMLRQSFVRIAGVAIVFFALPAVIIAVTEETIESIGPTGSLVIFSAALVALAIAGMLRILGPIAYSGFLDRAVAAEYIEGEHRSLREAMRSLPWRTLVAADIVVTLIVGIGLGLLIVPGLVLYGLLGLIGPVVVQEGAGLMASLRRTIGLARRSPVLVALLVVIPFVLDEIIQEAIQEALHSSGLGAEILAEWILAILVGGTLGLLEVALAVELIARNPRDAVGLEAAGSNLAA